MKLFAKLLGSATMLFAAMCLHTAYGNPLQSSVVSKQIFIPIDTLATANKMRVVFIPKSTYKNFRIGIESAVKTDVNIQVINQKGLVVYSNLLERVSKKLEEIDFSFLKSGEYTVKVTNQQDEYSKKMVIP